MYVFEIEKESFNVKCKQAITKIREYLIQKIYSLRKPMGNYQLIQDSMLKLR